MKNIFVFFAFILLCFFGFLQYVEATTIVSSTDSGTSQIYWGAYIEGSTYGSTYGNVPWDTKTWNLFESHTGKGISILHWGQPWHWTSQNGYPGIRDGHYQKFYSGDFNSVRQRGTIPFLDWGTWSLDAGGSTNQPTYSLSHIIAGNFDDYITQWATDAKNWKHPFFLRLDWEMNGNWYPWSEQTNGNSAGQYIQMWRHVHDIFTTVGATNVTWVWCPNITTPSDIPLSQYYPGDTYVDWTCLDGYNWGQSRGSWQTFASVFQYSYDQLRTIAPTKPIIIGETASSEHGGSKAAWITDMLQTQLPMHFPLIKGVLWFNWNADGITWSIESSVTSQQAFASGISSSYFTANSYANIFESPIAPPAASPIPTLSMSSPSPTPTQKAGDANGDGIVNSLDFVKLFENFGRTTSLGPSDGDFDRSGKVNALDYVILFTNYGK